MKCPKCGYISFDNNQVCPKCNRDISYEQEKLNFPAFRPNPPALLGALTGEVIESHVDMQIDQSYHEDVATDIITEEDVNYEDSGVIDMGEISFDDSGALDSGEVAFSESQRSDIDLELGETTEFESPDDFESLPHEESVSDLDLDSLSDSSEIMLDVGEPGGEEEEEISFDLENLSDEEEDTDGIVPLESPDEEESEVSIDFEDLAMDEPESIDEPPVQEPEIESDEMGIDFDAMSLEEPESMGEPEIEESDISEPHFQEPEEEIEEPSLDFDEMSLESTEEESEEIELGLEDLEIDESGELAVKSESEEGGSATGGLLDLEDIDLELDDLDDEIK